MKMQSTKERPCRRFNKICFGFVLFLAISAFGQYSKIMVFHKVNGFVHTETEASISAFKEFASNRGMEIYPTIDSLKFNPDTLATYHAVVFINTNYRNGRLLNDQQEKAFEEYIQNGGGFVGVHSSVPLDGSWEETIWPWFAELFGARFDSHPQFQEGEMRIEDARHISTRNVGTVITLRDEWYWLQSNPRNDVNILAVQVGESMTPSWKGDRPVSWYREFQGGRTWVTLVGHDLEAFQNHDFLEHVYGGILYASGRIPGCTDSAFLEYDSTATVDDGSCSMVKVARHQGKLQFLKLTQYRGNSFSFTHPYPGAHVLEMFDLSGKSLGKCEVEGGNRYRFTGFRHAKIVILKISGPHKTWLQKAVIH